jgi:hypothetical protein
MRLRLAEQARCVRSKAKLVKIRANFRAVCGFRGVDTVHPLDFGIASVATTQNLGHGPDLLVPGYFEYLTPYFPIRLRRDVLFSSSGIV